MCSNENSDKIIKNQKFLLNLTEKSASGFQIDQPATALSSSSSASPPSAGSQDIIATTPPPPSVTPQHHNYHHHHHHNQQQSSSSLSTLGQHPQLARYIRQSPLIGVGTFRSAIGTTTTTSSSSASAAAAAQAAAQAAAAMSSMLGNNVVPPGLLPPLDHYRLQLYNYAMVERLRCSQYPGPLPLCPPGYPAAAAAAAVNGPYGPRFALSMSLFHNRVFQPEEPKPQHSYIGLIAMAILSSPESKLVLSDIYQHILDNYPYFRTRGPGWRNSIRHNLSLNDCFVKAGRSANGKGHYWAIHEANLEDFKKGDFRRRKAQRKVRKHMGLSVDDEGTDSPSPPPLAVTPPPLQQNVVGVVGGTPFCTTSWAAAAAVATAGAQTTGVMANIYSQSRKRQFDVASLLAPDEDNQQQHQRNTNLQSNHHHLQQQQQQQQQIHSGHYQTDSSYHNQYFKGPLSKRIALNHHNSDIDEDIDVVASDVEDNLDNNQNISNNNNNNNDDDDNNQQQLAIINNNNDNNNHYDIQQHLQQQHQHNNDDDGATDSPISHQDDDIQHTNIPSPTGWQGLMQQAWPNNLNPLGAAMDPRILGRYYGQYMAAAAAQQVAASRRATFLNDTATAAAAAAAAANNCATPTNLTTNSGGIIGDNSDAHHQHHHHHHQHHHQQQQQHQQQHHHHHQQQQQRIQPKLEKIDLSPSSNEC